jgi:hypothetical protein
LKNERLKKKYLWIKKGLYKIFCLQKLKRRVRKIPPKKYRVSYHKNVKYIAIKIWSLYMLR